MVRLIKWSVTLLAVIAAGAMIDLAVRYPAALHGLQPWVLPAICLSVALLAWIPLRTPVVRVTADQVSVGAWPFVQRIARSELAYIFRGLVRGRYGWSPTYLLVTRDDTPRISLMAESFKEAGMTELAERLQVPIKGDFTAKVR